MADKFEEKDFGEEGFNLAVWKKLAKTCSRSRSY